MEFAKNLLNEQRRRMVGSLMSYIEHNIYPVLSPEERTELRSKVLASTSAYHDVCLDMLKASVADGTTLNDEALQLIHGMRADLKAMRRDA
jgi:hypothetical protein